jgi:hypothetical protein
MELVAARATEDGDMVDQIAGRAVEMRVSRRVLRPQMAFGPEQDIVAPWPFAPCLERLRIDRDRERRLA